MPILWLKQIQRLGFQRGATFFIQPEPCRHFIIVILASLAATDDTKSF
jgi:hypothetical protein